MMARDAAAAAAWTPWTRPLHCLDLVSPAEINTLYCNETECLV